MNRIAAARLAAPLLHALAMPLPQRLARHFLSPAATAHGHPTSNCPENKTMKDPTCCFPSPTVDFRRERHCNRTGRHTIARLAALFTLLLTGPLASAANYYVGVGAECYPTLADALAASAEDPAAEIRLLIGTHTTSRQFISRSLTLRGGYSSCTAPTPASGVRSGLLNPDNRTLVIDGAADDRRQVLIENISFSGNRYWNGDDPPGGIAGGVVVRGPVDVTLRNSSLEFVHASQPGGAITMLSLPSGVPSVTLEDSLITNASSEQDGGGIHCAAGNVTLRRSTISNGRSADRGGAIHANTCEVDIHDSLFVHNRTRLGGAIYSTGSGSSPRTRLFARRTQFRSNDAADTGGALLLSNADAYLEDVKFLSNRSVFGHALWAYSSFVSMEGRSCTRFTASSSEAICSAFSGHQMSADHTMISLRNSSVMVLAQTMLANNVGAARTQLIDSRHSYLLAYNSSFTANTALEKIIHFRGDNHTLHLEHVSMHGNDLISGRAQVEIIDDDPSTPTTPVFRVKNSIVEGASRGFPFTLTGAPGLECVVIDQPWSGLYILQTDDPGIDDDGLHLKANSPAIDFCLPLASSSIDADGDPRPHDDPNMPDAGPGRTADAGADERLERSVLFASGFESGS
ncbi:MAG TPA: hypothetical protein PKZ76_09040 [Xanthomonadaceae bacterium]|nr:hypothetical protein [Xanthomonadaceae bacterium]